MYCIFLPADLLRLQPDILHISAAGIATASLVKSVADGRIDPEKIVMLNITGGGEHRCQQDKELWYLEPSLVFPLTPDPEEVVAKTEALFD